MILPRPMRAAFALLATGTLSPAGGPAQESPRTTTLTVFAAASLTESFRELGTALEKRQPGLVVRFNFANSQQIAVQLGQGARADVLATADERWMAYAVEHKLIADSATVFAHNRLVVITPRANPGKIERLEDLARPGLKVVLVAETVPAGTYSRTALANLARAPGFPANYRDRVLANVVSHEETVRAAATRVQLGEADAAIVYRSDVTPAISPHVRVLEIPDAYNVVARYPAARLRDASAPDAARAFLALLLSAQGQETLRRHGLIPVRSTP